MTHTVSNVVRGSVRRIRIVRLARALFLGVAGFSTCGVINSVARAQSLPPAPVIATDVREETIRAGQSFVGTVMPVRRAVIGSAVDGRVLEFPCNEGDRVTRGQTLAQLRTRTMELELASAKAEAEAARQELAEFEAGTRREEIDQARARHAAAHALRTFAVSRAKRLQTLYERRSASEDEVQEALSASEAAIGKEAEAKAALDLAVAGPRKERVLHARAKVLALEENCNRLQDQIDRHTVVCPFDGYVVSEHTEVGSWVMRGQPVVEVVEMDYVDIQISVLERHIKDLKRGTEGRVRIAALGDRVFVGEVTLTVPQADLRSRSFPVKIRVKNELDGDRPVIQAGMLAQVTLPLGNSERAIVVPKDALVLGGPKPVVWVVEQPADLKITEATRTIDIAHSATGIHIVVSPLGEGAGAPEEYVAANVRELREKFPAAFELFAKYKSVQALPVELGIAHNHDIQVIAKLKPGQQVIVRGNERLMSGRSIELLPNPAEESESSAATAAAATTAPASNSNREDRAAAGN